MKARARFLIFAVWFLALVVAAPAKTQATYVGASYSLRAAEYYFALANQYVWYTGIYGNAVYFYYATNYLSVAQNQNSTAYTNALNQYIMDSNPDGYYAQYYAYLALSNTYYAKIYLSYVAFDENYFLLWANTMYLANYYMSLAAYYSGLAS